MDFSDIRFQKRRSIDQSVDISDVPLRPEEVLLSVKQINLKRPKQPMSPVEALAVLAGVEKPEDIGTEGPVIASRAAAADERNPELRMYETLFGRDALIVASFVFEEFPALTRSTLLRLAELQGIEYRPMAEEEPGKIVHEHRSQDDPIAHQLTALQGWQWPYYGSVDATILFIRLLTRYVLEKDPVFLEVQYVGRDKQQKNMRDALEAALAWVMKKMDENEEGFVESSRLNKQGGTINQVWKDSNDAYHHADGTLADNTRGVASIEVQAHVYDALHDARDLSQRWPKIRLGQTTAELEKQAEKLREHIWTKLWVENEHTGFFALGSDRDAKGTLRPLRVRTSNMGHLLNSRLLDGNDAECTRRKDAMVRTLFEPDMLNVSGIRTLSTKENRYRLNAYHNGSVWIWDTFYISLGLLRQGYTEEARKLWQRIRRVLETTKLYPEFVSGAHSKEPIIPRRSIGVKDTQYNFEHFIELPPQEIQAWTVAAAVVLVSIEPS